MAVTVAEKTIKLLNSAGPPLRVGYDASNYMDVDVAAAGDVTLSLTGTTPEFTFSDPVNLSSTLDVTGAVTLDSTSNLVGNVRVGSVGSASFVNGAGLEIDRAGIATLRLDNSSAGKQAEIYAGASHFHIRGLSSSQDMVFYTVNAEKMRLSAGGTLSMAGAATLDTGANGSSFGGDLTVSGDVLLSDGSASDPSLSFAGSSQLGLYRSAGTVFGWTASGSEKVRFDLGGPRILINESTNANMTTGLTIQGGASDNQHLAIKNSDISTGLTTAVVGGAVETDDFFFIQKTDSAFGGVRMASLAEDAAQSVVLAFDSYGGTATTTKTTSGRALMEFAAYEHDGANALANITADGNVFAVRARVGGSTATRILVDEDGDLYSVTAAQTFDDHDDLALLNRYDIVRRDDLRKQHAEWATEWEEELVALGVLGAPVAEGGMTNVTQLQRLMVGALRQTSDRLATLESENAQLRSQVQSLLQ